MPPKRRSASATARSQQSTLAFHGASNKVTKPGARAHAGKKRGTLEEPAAQEPKKAELAEIAPLDEDESTTAEAAIIEQTQRELAAQKISSTPEEDEARKITDGQIHKYWKQKEKERKAPRVHQDDLTEHEKILREFDMTGHYGPCTGIPRIKRWKRAHRLKLNPPLEVLAVLLKEQDNDKNNVAIQRSHLDELLSSRIAVEP